MCVSIDKVSGEKFVSGEGLSALEFLICGCSCEDKANIQSLRALVSQHSVESGYNKVCMCGEEECVSVSVTFSL